MEALPPEIMLRIFSEYQVCATEENDWQDEPSSSYRWIGITHVCQRWRDVILSSPLMWARIVLGESQNPMLNTAAVTFLQRSENVPLHVCILVGEYWYSDTGTPSLADLLQQSISRAAIVNICLQREDALDLFWSMLDVPAPLLSSLMVANLAKRRYRDMFLPHLFCGDTPSLMEFYFLDIAVCGPHPLLRQGLQYAGLAEWSHGPWLADPTPFRLSSLQAASSSLVSLDLTSRRVYLPPENTISLPALEELSIEGPTGYISAILDTIAIPDATTVDVCLCYDSLPQGPHPTPGRIYDPQELLRALKRVIPPDTPVRAMSVTCGMDLKYTLWTNRKTECHPEWDDVPPRLRFTNGVSTDPQLDLVALSSHFPLSSLEALGISSTAFPSMRWTSALEKMENVRTLEGRGRGAARYLVQLIDPRPSVDEGAVAVPFPRLSEVTLNDVGSVSVMASDLARVLSRRAKLGASVVDEVALRGLPGRSSSPTSSTDPKQALEGLARVVVLDD